MIVLMNMLISLLCFFQVYFVKNCNKLDYTYFNHFFLLSIKLILCSLAVLVTCLFSDKEKLLFIVLSGSFNLVLFHFLEGYILQVKLLKKGNIDD